MRTLRLVLAAMICCLPSLAALPRMADAGTTFEGDHIEMSVHLQANDFCFLSGTLRQGEQVAYAVKGGTFDLFILK